MRSLEAAARSDLLRQGFKPDDVYCQAYLNLRFHGTDTALMTPASPPPHKAPEPGGGGGGGGSDGGGGANDDDALQSFFDQYRSVQRTWCFIVDGLKSAFCVKLRSSVRCSSLSLFEEADHPWFALPKSMQCAFN